jgi:hypothetical protein
MSPKTKFNFWRWSYFVVLFLVIGLVGILLIGLFIAVPFLKWLMYDIPYALPTWDQIVRIALANVFIGVFCGTIVWYYEKSQSGR